MLHAVPQAREASATDGAGDRLRSALRTIRTFARRHPTGALGAIILAGLAALSLAAPLVAPHDPILLDVSRRLQPPSLDHPFGTDAFGRDVFSRTLYGGRVSMMVAIAVALLSTTTGVLIGLVAGFVRALDMPVLRVMDGLMAIPGILLAIALVALTKAGLWTIVVAIALPEIPRVVRIVRAVVLTIRDQPYIEAAIVTGSRFSRILFRHVLPNAIAPIIVQATFVCASAVILEAYLSFLGAGMPPETPSWGNIMAEGRGVVHFAVWTIVFPGLFLGAMVLAINLLGDALRDTLDPKISRQMR